MEIILGKTAGFCGGVKIAVDRAEKELKENKELYCLGELVHNREITNKLKNMGLLTVNDIMEVPDQKVVIIRAHGEPPRTYEEAKKRNIKIIDLTCPKVIKIHEKVEEYASKKYYIILIAEKEHPESIGTYGFCGEYAYIVKDENDVKEAVLEIEKTKIKNILMISQTTFSMEKFDYLVEKIKEDIGRDVNIVIDKSICDATMKRQTETEKISKEVDLMIIVGGSNSSNTQKLYEISKKNCKEVFFIQTKKDLDIEYIKEFDKIGVMAGASTPMYIVDEVINSIVS